MVAAAEVAMTVVSGSDGGVDDGSGRVGDDGGEWRWWC